MCCRQDINLLEAPDSSQKALHEPRQGNCNGTDEKIRELVPKKVKNDITVPDNTNESPGRCYITGDSVAIYQNPQ